MEPDNILDEIEEAMAYIPPVSTEPGTWQAAVLIRTITLFSDHPAARPSHLDQQQKLHAKVAVWRPVAMMVVEMHLCTTTHQVAKAEIVAKRLLRVMLLRVTNGLVQWRVSLPSATTRTPVPPSPPGSGSL